MLITLMTDFGYSDPFVGIMKGVILGIHAGVQIVDLSHDIPPQDIRAAALVLRHSFPYFNRGTIHVAVVDPGVGGARRPLLIESEGNYFVGPDNGVLSLAMEGKTISRIIHLSNPEYHLTPTSTTFHGRDIFASVAGHLSHGIPPPVFGDSITTFKRLTWPGPAKREGGLLGEIVYVDRFGNLFTNITEHDLSEFLGARLTIQLGKINISGVNQNYAMSKKGDFLALINSWGLLEIALYKDSALHRTGAKIGQKVEVIAAS